MIYFISEQSVNLPLDIEKASVQYALDYFKDKEEIGVDTETTGFDPFTKELLLLQIGDEYKQFVIDVSTINILLFKKLLETKIIILHNAKFDLKFLFAYGIYPYGNVFDTFLAERTLSLGIDSHRKSLAACVNRYFKYSLSKDIRGLIHKLGVTNERVIRYSAEDVEYLIPLKRIQTKSLTALNLERALSLDNKFVVVLAYVEYCGVYLDKEGWSKKSYEDLQVFKEKESILNNFVIENFKTSKYVDPPNLFYDKYTCKINWNSPKQVIPLFKELGIDTVVYEKGEAKDSLDGDNLKRQIGVHPIVSIFINFQQAKKLVTTYGLDFLKHINPATGRIHTNFTQLKNTGRLSSGKEDQAEAKIGEVNMQNIPAGKERNHFKCYSGNVCVVADYSGQETRVLAEFAQDPEFTDYISNPEKDLHSLMASFIFPELENIPHSEIEKNHAAKRKFAKPATFSIPYGGDGNTIANNLSLPKEKGDEVYNKFINKFPRLAEYYEKAKKQVLEDGYVLINSVSNRKSFIVNYEQFKAQKKKMNSIFWEMYRDEKAKNSDLFLTELKPFVSTHFKKKGSIERTGLNFPIQGTSADMSKLAGIYVYEWILKNKYWGIVKMCVPLHDEWFLECPEDLGTTVEKILVDSMIRAAKVFCKTIPFKASSAIADHWKH